MPPISSEMLVYGLVIAAFLLFNYVTQWLAKKARQARAEAAAATPAPVQATAPVDEYAWGRTPSVTPPADEPQEFGWGSAPSALPPVAAPVVEIQAPALAELAPPTAAPRRRRAGPHPLFATKKDLRHAIVVMTVLGPCRALDPPA